MPTTKGLPRSYAAGLQAALETRLPGVLLQIDNLSEKNHTAMQMAEKLARTVAPMQPDLVLWQTGNVDAAQQIDINDFSAALERSEEHTSELQSLMRISYAVFCLKKKKQEK